MRLGPDPSTPRGAALVERRFAAVRARGEHAALRERPGPLPVVLAAPHALGVDPFTGPLALAVARLTGASALVAGGRAGADPVGADTPFSARLRELSAAGKLVVDLHAVDSGDVDLVVSAFGCDAALVDAIVEVADEEDLVVAVDVPVPGDHGWGRLESVAPALFVAVGSRCRAPLERPDEWEALVDALVGVVGLLVPAARR